MTRIDKLTPGSHVTLRFCGLGPDNAEPAVFVKVEGEGDDRHAHFISKDGTKVYEWEAYRFEGRWSYGSGAEALYLLSVDRDPFLN